MKPEEKKRRSGPVPGPVTRKYTVLLEPVLADWAKEQPGGLSELVRRLLREARMKQEGRK
jgi:hypothetical protein